MTSLFDGMAGVLNDVFGAPITYRPVTGAPRVILSVFREVPIEVAQENGGSVWITAPTWRVPANLIPTHASGDVIDLPDGRSFRLLNGITGGSPASDGFRIFEMEAV